MESCPARRDQWTILGKRHELHSAILVERNSRAPPHPVAQPLSAVADRNVLWREDAADRFPGILGIRVAGTPQSLALSKMDSGNGPLCPPPAQGSVKSAPALLAVRRCDGTFQNDTDVATLAHTHDLCG